MGSTSTGRLQIGVLVGVLLAAGWAIAGRSEPEPVMRVATSGDYAPFSLWPSDQSEPTGFSIDVARAFARARGARIEWIRFRWPELGEALEQARFDVALSGISVRADRSLAGRFSHPLTATHATALVRTPSRLASRADLDDPRVRIAVNRGGHLERVARALFAHARIEAVEGNAHVPERLATGAADAVLTDDLEAVHWRRALPATRAIGPLSRDAKAALFPRAEEALARAFDAWLVEFERSGELARVRARHGLAAEATAEPIYALLARIDERLSLMPGVAAAKEQLDLPVEDPAQEARVKAAFRTDAARAAASLEAPAPDDAALDRFGEVLLEAARVVQARPLADRTPDRTPGRSTDRARTEQARRELEGRLRPAIAYLSERIAWLAVASRAASAAPTREAVTRALERHALPPALEAKLHAALLDLMRPRPGRRPAPAPPLRREPRDTAPSA